MLARKQETTAHADIAGGNVNGTFTRETSLTVPCKAKHAITIGHSNCIPGHLPQRNGNHVHTKTCTHMFIEALFIIARNFKRNCQMFFNRWVVKQVRYSTHGILLSNKGNEWMIDTQQQLRRISREFAEWKKKKPIPKVNFLNDKIMGKKNRFVISRI